MRFVPVKNIEQQALPGLRQRLEAIPGIGPLTGSALVVSIDDAKTFKNGRQMAAWLGLVP
jgi:transposase